MKTAKQESLTEQESLKRSEIASLSDDRRRVKTWPMVRILILVRESFVCVFFFVAAFTELFVIVEKLGVPHVGLAAYRVSSFMFCGGFALLVAGPFLIPFLIKRYREQEFKPVDSASFGLIRYRQKSDRALDEAGFQKVGTFRVQGEAFHTRSEVYLGCQRMVVAVFLSRPGTRTTELVSLTESGRVIVTRSEAAIEGEPAEIDQGSIVVTTVAESPLESLLAVHLKKSTERSEEADSLIAELSEGDVVDVLRYYNRAHHNMLVARGLASGKVGPMTYGRFRFPLGVLS